MTIQELAKLSQVSVRTLHYYDEIGLLRPVRSPDNNYRIYGQSEVIRLQHILFFRELDFSLDKIREIMDSPRFDPILALQDQKSLLEQKRKRLDALLLTIENTIISMKGGDTTMSTDDAFSAFNDPTYRKYKDETEQRWGKADAYKQSMERVAKMSQNDLEKIKAELDDINQQVATLMHKGESIDSDDVQAQIDRHFTQMCKFYDPTPAMYTGLGQMYVQDPRFGIHYETVASGLAVFMRDAMEVYARKLH